ncbi:MAG: hypothetical protein CSA05_00930 [Bacteroidia bacterium]|nr:MAG: hypothetical protein CSA05_00930 [Bacteroidia bacterium]
MFRDIEEIELLRKKNTEAVIKKEAQTLANLWSEDGILILPDTEPLSGIDAIRAYLKKSLAELQDVKIVKYELHFNELNILDEYAFEWGRYHQSFQLPNSEEIVEENGKLMRILVKNKTGEWKIMRALRT